jgi:tetratricopeptide (TPR) repeat protein
LKSAASASAADRSSGLDAGREALASGKLDLAERISREALDKQPADADALCMLGEIEYRRGNNANGAQWLERALASDRRHARAHWLSGNFEQDRGNVDRAIASYRRALRAKPDFAEAHNDLGTAYFSKGWHPEAEQCYRRTLELQPQNLAATENLAATLRAQGRLREARDAFIGALKMRLGSALRKLLGRKAPAAKPGAPTDEQRSQVLAAIRKAFGASDWKAAEAGARRRLAEAPDDPDALHLLGRTLAAQGRRQEALVALERVLQLRTSSPEDYVSLGNILTDDSQYERAIENYKLALMLDPGHGSATANIARVLHERGHFREAEEIYRLSLERDPDIAGAHSSLASTLLSLGRFTEAESAARRALALNPKSVHGLMMLASALIEQGRVPQAQQTLAQAEDIDRRHPQLLRALAGFHMMLRGDFERAEELLREAAAIAPDDPNIHINLARSLLIRERYAEGWEEYEWRRRDPGRSDVYVKLPYAEWDGSSSLAGKSIVVNGEQGLGDEIMYVSCLKEVAGAAARCVLYCHRRLETLFRRSFPGVEVVGGSHLRDVDPFPVLSNIDLQVAAGSLPRAFRRNSTAFPAHSGYLKADPAKVESWEKRLDDLGPGLKIGLSWKGGTPLSDATRRTMTLEALGEVLELGGTHWVSLQYGDCFAEREAFGARTGVVLHHWQDSLDDLDETAALMCALDLRISVCNTQVHISGALGKEVWVMTPLSPDWRYGHAGESMRWYPAARMFRQPAYGDWRSVVDAIGAALKARLAG